MPQKIALFGGAFDPIHNGHIRLALEFARRLGLDRVLLMPSYVPPHKLRGDMAVLPTGSICAVWRRRSIPASRSPIWKSPGVVRALRRTPSIRCGGNIPRPSGISSPEQTCS